MYAVIRTGGKQYRVKEGDVIEVEHLVSKSSKVSFVPILVVTDDGKTIYGRKELKAYTVSAKMVGDAKGDKINVLKYRPKSGYATHTGHRQLYSLIEVSSIGSKGTTKKAESAEEAAGAPDDAESTDAKAEEADGAPEDTGAPDAKAEEAAGAKKKS